jgi:DNA repair exonuclease SbcCD ATPase subunit
MLTRPSPLIVAVVALTGLLGACASQSAREHAPVDPFEQADYAAAVADYELRVRRLSSVDEDPELVMRLALARAVDGHLGHDPGRARELLEELAQTSTLRGEATALLRLLDSLAASEQRLAVLEPQATRAVEAQLDLVELVMTYLKETAELRGTIAAREQSLQELKRRLRSAEAEAARLARELDELKSIDLSHPD